MSQKTALRPQMWILGVFSNISSQLNKHSRTVYRIYTQYSAKPGGIDWDSLGLEWQKIQLRLDQTTEKGCPKG